LVTSLRGMGRVYIYRGHENGKPGAVEVLLQFLIASETIQDHKMLLTLFVHPILYGTSLSDKA